MNSYIMCVFREREGERDGNNIVSLISRCIP